MIEKVKNKGLALAVLASAQFMVILDATIVNVALPAIYKALHFTSSTQLQWIITAYALVFGGFLLLGGRLADIFGRRRVFLAGVALFAVASMLGGFATNPTMLIVFRGLQGLGGAMLAPAALSLVLTIFNEGAERNKALGIWSMVAGGGGAVGLLLGGVLTQYADWRWVFFINAPIAVAVIIAALRFVPNSLPSKKERIDFAGAITITASLMSLVYALAKVPEFGWGSMKTISVLALSAVLMAAFIINELRVSHPLMKLSIFRRRNVTGGSIIQLLMPASLFGMFFYLSIYMQQILHYTPVQNGASFVPFTLTLIVIAGVLSRRMAKFNPKVILTVAPLAVATGLLYLSRIPVHSNYLVDVLPGILLMAGGMAMVFVTNSASTTSGVSPQEAGLVSGLLNVGQQIGGAVGLAVLSVISAAVTKTDLTAGAHLDAALVHGFQRGFLVGSLFAVAASLTALVVLKPHKLTAKEAAQQPEMEAEALAAIPGA